MATPATTALPDGDEVGGEEAAPLGVDISTTTSPSVSEGEEGLSSGDESVLKLLGKHKSEQSKTLLKIKKKVLMKNKV